MERNSEPDPTPRRRLTPEDRREEILAVARAAFSESRLLGTTMRDVAERAGITETHLYRHFRKEELFDLAIQAPLEDLEAQVVRETRELAARPETTRAELLERFHTLCLSSFVQLAPLLRAGILPTGRERPMLQLGPLLQRWHDLVLSVIDDVTGWDYDPRELNVMVNALTGLYLVIALEGMLQERPVDIRRTAAELTAMFAPSRVAGADRAALTRAARRSERTDDGPLGAGPETSVAASAVDGADSDGPRRRLSKAERRESILSAAGELFGEVGISGARSREIAERAAITETFMYRIFDSKEEIYAAAIEAPADAALGELADAITRLASERQGIAFVNELNILGLRFLRAHERLLTTVFLADVDRSRRFYRERAQRSLDTIARLIVTGMGYDTAEISPQTARQAILGAQWGVAVNAVGSGAESTPERAAIGLTRLFTMGVKPAGKGRRRRP
jgi:AcrR family transcriptional regulator